MNRKEETCEVLDFTCGYHKLLLWMDCWRGEEETWKERRWLNRRGWPRRPVSMDGGASEEMWRGRRRPTTGYNRSLVYGVWHMWCAAGEVRDCTPTRVHSVLRSFFSSPELLSIYRFWSISQYFDDPWDWFLGDFLFVCLVVYYDLLLQKIEMV